MAGNPVEPRSFETAGLSFGHDFQIYAASNRFTSHNLSVLIRSGFTWSISMTFDRLAQPAIPLWQCAREAAPLCQRVWRSSCRRGRLGRASRVSGPRHLQFGRHSSQVTADLEEISRNRKAFVGCNQFAPGDGTQMDFAAPAVLKKWPSKEKARAKDVLWPSPYLVFDGTLDECIKKFLERPVGQRHLYEIHTAPQGELIPAVISSELVVEIARLRDFL